MGVCYSDDRRPLGEDEKTFVVSLLALKRFIEKKKPSYDLTNVINICPYFRNFGVDRVSDYSRLERIIGHFYRRYWNYETLGYLMTLDGSLACCQVWFSKEQVELLNKIGFY